MRINGRNRLACKTLIKDLDISKPIYVEPIKGLPVEKDLIVDMTPFYKAYLEINPFLVATDKPKKERLQSPEDRARYDDTTKCILLCRLHKQLSCVLDRWSVLRPSCNRERPPIHL